MRTAYVHISYLDTLEPSDVGLPNTCTDEEFEGAVFDLWDSRVKDIYLKTDFPFLANDINIEICDWEE